jgi:SAM-dependent methyltransferase
MNWQMKAITQKILGCTPGGRRLNHCLQCWLGGLSKPAEDVAGKVGDWQDLMDALGAVGVEGVEGATVCEIGSGWHPTIPLCFYLIGAGKIFTTDINRHMDPRIALGAVAALEPHLDRIAHAGNVGLTAARERFSRLKNADSMEHMLSLAGITYWHGPVAGRINRAPERSIDIAFSNNVLEHVPEDQILELARDTARALKPGGVTVHAVACNDHYAHFDPTISFANFLQFSDEEWRKKWDNGILWQNRLRAPDFLKLWHREDAPVIYRKQVSRPGTIDAIRKMQVDQRFARYSLEDLAATTIHLVARA